MVAYRSAIPEIRDYRLGHDVGINVGTFDFVVVADFSSADDYVIVPRSPATALDQRAHRGARCQNAPPSSSTRSDARPSVLPDRTDSADLAGLKAELPSSTP